MLYLKRSCVFVMLKKGFDVSCAVKNANDNKVFFGCAVEEEVGAEFGDRPHTNAGQTGVFIVAQTAYSGHLGKSFKRSARGVQEPKRGFQVLGGNIFKQVIQVLIRRRFDLNVEFHAFFVCWWCTRSSARFRSQYSGVTSIGSPESSPSNNWASSLS